MLGDVPRILRGNRAHVDNPKVRTTGRDDALGAEKDFADGAGVLEHRDDHVGLLRDVLWAVGPRRPFLDERSRLRFGPVPDDDGESGLQKVARHRRAHVPETDEPDDLRPLHPLTNHFIIPNH